MPKINRVRIINFSYNNSNRHIQDEIFNFYNGENVLLNLKNGGGKSVLVQLLLQPIIPKIKLQNRKIEEFFTGKKTPCYVLIEWILEDKGGYLLTGIGMSRRESRTKENGDSNNDLKYFNFTSKYKEANEYDIDNIPLVHKKNKGIEILEYKEARNLIAGKVKDLKYEISFFADDDKTEYKNELSSFNISQEEWRSIILKINESEGGVIEIFEKCKSSQQLMNEWILKSIEKVINKDDEKDNKKLELMLENLVKDTISNEKFIKEKEIFEDFLNESEIIIDELNNVVNSLGKEEKTKETAASLFYYIDISIKDMQNKLNNNREKLYKLQEQLKLIDLEEKSKAYYDAVETVEELKIKREKISHKLTDIRENIKALEKEKNIELSARDYKSICMLKEQLVGIRIEIDRILKDEDEEKKIRNLEYSLKILYDKKLKDLNDELTNLNTVSMENQGLIEENKIELKELKNKADKKNKLLGGINKDITYFQIYEEKIKTQLKLKYVRNMLGEIEKGYLNEILKDYNNTLSKMEKEKAAAENLIEEKENYKPQLKEQEEQTRQFQQDNAVKTNEVENEMETYYTNENKVKIILEKHNIPGGNRFLQEENIRNIEGKKNQKDIQCRACEKNLESVNEILEGIKNGTVNLPKRFIDFLKEQSIQYQTGENYLRKLHKEERELLLQKNPLLPYAFIMTKEEIEALDQLEVEFNINRMIPIIDFKDLEKNYSKQNNMVSIPQGISFLCLYDKNIIDFDNIAEYEDRLKKEKEELENKINNCIEYINEYNEDIQKLKIFNYEERYIKDLQIKRNKLMDSKKEIEEKLESIKRQYKDCEYSIKNLNIKIHQFEAEICQINSAIEKFKEFIEKDKSYISSLENRNLLDREIREIKNREEEIEKIQEQVEKHRYELGQEIGKLKNVIKEIEQKYNIYKNAPEGEIIEGSIDILESQLQVLKSTISSTLERLKSDEERIDKDIVHKEEDIKRYGILKEEYINREYSKEKLDNIISDINKTTEEESKLDCEERTLGNKLAVKEDALERAKNALVEISQEPLPKSDIKRDFKKRRQLIKKESSEIDHEISGLNDEIYSTTRLQDKVGNIINIEEYEFSNTYRVKNNIHKDFEDIKKELKITEQESKQYKSRCSRKLNELKEKFREKHHIINSIFEGVTPLIEGLEENEKNYYYLGERMLQNKETLLNMIKACEFKLESVEKNKKDMIQHSYLQAKIVYDEIEKVIENSSIHLDGKTRPIPMLKIDMEPLGEEVENREKMRLYIEDCISQINKDMKANLKQEDIYKKMARFMSTRELLNILSDLSKAKIKAYKIDINVKNSMYKTWEQVMKQNSGGERFVSFFAVLAALMSYTRNSEKYNDDYTRNKDTKAIIMDNPFGPISSEHLLKPLFSIAEKYNTQLICLTDLDKNSILNCFNLIYRIKIRQNVLRTREYIQLEQQIHPGADLTQDENLEKAVFKAQEVEQISLLT